MPLIEKIFNVYAPKFAERSEQIGQKGGYTTIHKLGMRRGDAAEMAIIEVLPIWIIAWKNSAFTALFLFSEKRRKNKVNHKSKRCWKQIKGNDYKQILFKVFVLLEKYRQSDSRVYR